MKKTISISALVFLLIVGAFVYWDQRKVNLCGKKFFINKIVVDGVDIAKRVTYLVDDSYKSNPSVDLDNCENILNNTSGDRLIFDATTTSYLDPSILLIRVSDTHNYLKAWAYRPSTGKIYNTNEMDGSIRNELGGLK